jgi:hypothetical protein
MPLLNEADEIYIGSDPLPAEQVYLGDTPIWTFACVFVETTFEPLGAFISGSISTS